MYLIIDREKKQSLTKQIYDGIKDQIFSGDLNAHEKLPSTRQLATELGVSRTIIIDVYDQLAAEGYTYPIESSGTFVSEGVHFEKSQDVSVDDRSLEEFLYEESKGSVTFRTGVPDLSEVPKDLWARLYRNAVLETDPLHLDYHNPMGYQPLRKAISDYLLKWRGVKAGVSQIVITSGAAQAISLLKAFISEGDSIMVENPVSPGSITTLENQNIPIRTTPMDEKGLLTDLLPPKASKLIFTTPSHQFPTGAVMHISRRIQLIHYAHAHDCYIVEDDYDSEFRYEGEPIQSLQNLDPERVIYIGTFSKTFCPAVRMGYMIVPAGLIGVVQNAKYNADIHSPLFEQMAMADFMDGGHYERHIRKMKKIYSAKKDLIKRTVEDLFGNTARTFGSHSGLHLLLQLEGVQVTGKLMEKLSANGVEAKALTDYFYGVTRREDLEGYALMKPDQCLVLGFGNLSGKEIVTGLERIHQCVKDMEASNDTSI